MRPKSAIGERIFQRLIELGKGPEWLAGRMDTSPARISQLMRQEGFHAKTLAKAARALKVRPSYFFTRPESN